MCTLFYTDSIMKSRRRVERLVVFLIVLGSRPIISRKHHTSSQLKTKSPFLRQMACLKRCWKQRTGGGHTPSSEHSCRSGEKFGRTGVLRLDCNVLHQIVNRTEMDTEKKRLDLSMMKIIPYYETPPSMGHRRGSP
jgi:hypothetical protein